MAKSKYTDLVCLVIIVFMLMLTVLLMNGEKFGIEPVDTGSSVSGYSSLVQLKGSTAKIRGGGAITEGNCIKITAGGRYTFTGEFEGSILVETKGSEDVVLVLNGASVTCSDGPAVLVNNTGSLTIKTETNSQNSLVSGAAFSEAASSVGINAAVYCEDDLVLDGKGSLLIICDYAHGISAKDSLVCKKGDYEIRSAMDGIRARDSIEILGGTYTITAGNDGIKSKNDLAEDMGNVLISGGTIRIASQHDGIQSANGITVSGGDINIITGEGSSFDRSKAVLKLAEKRGGEVTETVDTGSHKGLKASGTIEISDGTVFLDCEDDGIHSDAYVFIDGGELNISSGDDAAHADTALTVNAGKVTVPFAYKGLEGHAVIITGGDIEITSNGDSVSANGDSGGALISISGGSAKLTSHGDAIDSNGSVDISGGEILAFSENYEKNRPLEYDSKGEGTCCIQKGTFLGFGGGECRDTFQKESTQPWSLQTFSNTQTAGTTVAFGGIKVESLFDFDYILLSGEDLSSFELNGVAREIQ